jgi:hypothetical protein
LLVFVAPVALWRMGRDTAQSVRDTLARSADTISAVRSGRTASRLDWNATVAQLGVTEPRIAREVVRRQVAAFFSALFFLIGLYGAVRWSALLPGLGCAALAAVYYVQATLRLHQIRHREFVSVGMFLMRVRREPREALPSGLPRGWSLYGEGLR